jgi:hypothetical protein
MPGHDDRANALSASATSRVLKKAASELEFPDN